MTAKRPRKSHYLPKFYLAGFTASGEIDDALYVFDQAKLADWPSSPKKAATERDCYLVDLGPSEDPDVIEKVFSYLEMDFSRVLRDIITRRQLPAGAEDFNWFVNFVASMVVRIPRTRTVAAGVIDRSIKAELRQVLATPEGWATFRQKCLSAGHHIREDEHEEYKRFAESENFTADLDQTSHMRMMTKEMMDALLPALAERSWSLGISTDDAPDLVCSDMPVRIFPAKGADIGKPINILSRDSVLSFPINRRLIALARYEKRSPVQVVIPRGVALMNYWTLSDARQIFSPAPEFSFMTPDGRMMRKSDLVEFHRRTKTGA